MDEIRTKLADCCKKLRLSASLADRAITQEGDTNQEYLLNLLLDEIANRDAARIYRLSFIGLPRWSTCLQNISRQGHSPSSGRRS